MANSLLARITGSNRHPPAGRDLSRLSPADLASRRTTAEAAVADAEAQHRKAALNVEQQVPGAVERLMEAVTVLQQARDKCRDLTAAQVECEAQEAERQRQAKAATADAQDRALVKALTALENAVMADQEAAQAKAATWEALVKANEAFRAVAVPNPRVREYLHSGLDVKRLAESELARVATADFPLAPGGRWPSASRDPASLTPSSAEARQFVQFIRDELATAKAREGR